MKKIVFTILTTLTLLGIVFKILNPEQNWNNQEFLEYMSRCPNIRVEDVISVIQTDWGSLDFIRTLFNTIITVFNFAIKIISNITQAILYIIYLIGYFFNITEKIDNQNTSSGGGGGDGWRGGR